MTDTSFLLATHPAALPFPVTSTSRASPLPHGSPSDTNLPEEEEYTIKCICSYADDDGNTVLCEKCDTWQHIDCYYHNKDVPDVHFCADCDPRTLDAKTATERQRRLREGHDGGDRKIKKTTSKTSKKKQKNSPTPAEQVNGWHIHDRQGSSSRDQPPPAKKPKTSHRTSGSIVSINGEGRKRASSHVQSYPSPSKSPQELYRFPPIPLYTSEFLNLYDRDEGNCDAHENEHTLQALQGLSAWRLNESLCVPETQQPSSKSPFSRALSPINDRPVPKVSVEVVTNQAVECDGHHPTWRLLRTKDTIKKNQLVGEIRGEVGMLEEWCSQTSSPNRWNELNHPDPFVFFHPHMNIYIDCRKAGTQFRYLRRSCQSNVTLKTFVGSGDELSRHCFVASKDIPANTELTVQWWLDPKVVQNAEQHSGRQYEWFSRVLANFGDCACGLGQNCLLAQFDCRQPIKLDASKPGAGRKKKNRTKHAISPSSTGHATNSRAGSEAVKGHDEDEDDHRSSTASSRSRDLTPTNVAVLDADPILKGELTAREIRKIQAMEKAFKEKESGAQEKQKKKKRTSGGSTMNTPNIGTTKQLGFDTSNGLGSPTPVRSGRQNSRGPTALAQSSRPAYTDTSTQTEPEEEDHIMPPRKRRKFLTPTQRLLKVVLGDRLKYDMMCNSPSAKAQSNTDTTKSDEVEMRDVGTSPVSSSSGSVVSPVTTSCLNSPTPTLLLPSQAAHSHHVFKPPAPKLHLENLPPVPPFPNCQTMPTPGSTTTSPAIASPSVAQSPFSSLNLSTQGLSAGTVTPSPAKKKLSLGDYMSRHKMAATPVTEKGNALSLPDPKDSPEDGLKLRPTESTMQEFLSGGSLSGSAVVDTPMKDETEEPEYSPPDASHVIYTSSQLGSQRSPSNMGPELANVLARLAQYNGNTNGVMPPATG